MNVQMDTEIIKAALAERYRGRGWAKFFEYRPMTSFAATLSAIDLVVVGLWKQTDKIIAFEIKSGKADYRKDLDNFRRKHEFALKISHEFYYVCPWGLIDKTEVPEIAGLMYINKANKIQIIKRAMLRELDSFPFYLLQGFAREFGNTVDYTKIPVKYLGKDMTQEDLMEIVEKEKSFEYNREVKEEVEKIMEKRREKETGRDLFLRELFEICGFYRSGDESYAEMKRYCELGKKLSVSYDFLHYLDKAKENIDKLLALISKEVKKDEKAK